AKIKRFFILRPLLPFFLLIATFRIRILARYTGKMRHLCLILFLLPGFSFSYDIEARFDHATFYAPGTGHYIESYVNVIGHSVKYKTNENKIFQAKVEITGIIYKGKEIVTF